MSDQFNRLYELAANEHGLDPRLLRAQAQVESSMNPKAYNAETGASGLAQLIPDTARRLGVTDPTDPEQAIRGQAKLMAENIKRYKDPNTAVLAYHGGTDKSNWGEKTNAYAGRVMKTYQELVDAEEVDPFEVAKKRLAAKAKNYPTEQLETLPSNSPGGAVPVESIEVDPFEVAKARLAKKKTEQVQQTEAKAAAPGVLEDVGLTALDAPLKAMGAIPQIPAMAGNAIANGIGYVSGKLMDASPEQQNKLNNLNPFFTGNTLPDALLQAGKGVAGEDPGQPNPLTGTRLHEPQTIPGKLTNAGLQGIIAGPAAGVKALPSLLGGIGAEVGAEALPNNPLAPLIGGMVGGGAVPTASALKLRFNPEDVANNVIKNSAGSPIEPNAIVSHEIIPGSRPTLAQITNDPNVALLERQMQAKDPAAFKAIEEQNETARQQHFDNAAGTPQDIETLRKQRSAAVEPLYEQARVQPLNPKAIDPVLGKIDAAIEQVGEGSDAGKTLADIRSRIAGALPSEDGLKNKTQSPIIQIFREQRDRLDKPAHAEGAYAATVKSVIKPIVKDLGEAIESQSQPFADAQKLYRDQSPIINSMEWMQNLKLTDASGRFTLAKVKNALENAKKLEKGSSTGKNKGKHVTPDQLQVLEDLHSDLSRREDVARASMPRGSNTAQNMLATEAMDSGLLGKTNRLMGGAAPEILGSGVGSVLGSAVGLPGLGSFAGNMTGRSLKNMSAARTGAAEANLKNYLLNPEAYKQFLMENKDNTFVNRLQEGLFRKP